jgi:hypothetical protein
MPTRPKNKPVPPPELDLRTKIVDGPLSPDMKRFNIFLIDTGWNKPISKAVRDHVQYLFHFNMHDSLYELTPAQSIEILRREPSLIGNDPSLVVYDLYGSDRTNVGNYHGFRLNLGLMRNAEQAVARLQEFVRFIATHRTAERLDQEIRRELHREGLDGMVKLLRETTVDLLVE